MAVSIPLDKRLSPSANAQAYYKKYTKSKTARVRLTEQLAAAEEELPEVYYALAERVGRHFDGNVAVRRDAKGGGTITIRFDNQQQVESFLEYLNR